MGVSVTLYLPVDAGRKEGESLQYREKDHYVFFGSNTTHNLAEMADKAGLYIPIWRPYKLFTDDDKKEDDTVIKARDLIELLRDGYNRLIESPEDFRQYDSPNGWGTYERFLTFVSSYINACKRYPYALVDVSR